MLKRFFGGDKAELQGDGWPLGKIVTALETKYGAIEKLGQDGPLKVYGVNDNGVNFVVALMQSSPSDNDVVEIGFLARFVGFPVNAQLIESLNRNLHISVAAIEGGEMFLMAGVQVTGVYDDGQFMLLLEAWRRDLAVTLGNLNGDQYAYSSAFPAAKLSAAREFATNKAPEGDAGQPFDMLSSFLGGDKMVQKKMSFCPTCNGRGKIGLFARTCPDCGGAGLV